MPYGGNKFHRKKADPNAPVTEKKPRSWPKIVDGVKYDSPLELYTVELLREKGIPFEFKRKYVLFKSFNYCGETVMGLTLTVDFYLTAHDIILDPKGNQNDGNPIKWKMLKKWLCGKGFSPRICFVYSQKQVREFVTMLRFGFTEEVKESQVNGRITKMKKVAKLVGSEFINKTGDVVCKLEELKTISSYDFDKLLKNNA